MQLRVAPASGPIDTPRYARVGGLLAAVVAVGAIPVGAGLIADPSGGSIGLPEAWIRDTVFRSYLVPGIYLLAANGLGMLLVAVLAFRRHRAAPWLMGALGLGLIVWIGVQLVLFRETLWLQWAYGAIGIALAGIALAWLRRTGQLRLR